MTSIAPVVLTFGPLAAYFAIQGVWSCSSRPRMVSGSLDYLLMSFGLGALLAYGPVGDFLLGALLRSPGIFARLAWLSFLTTVALIFSGPAHRRILIYNIDPVRASSTLREALATLPGEYSPTLHGFEDRTIGRGIILKPSPRLRSAEVESYGRRADELIHAIDAALRSRLATDRRRPAWPVAIVWFTLALLTLGLPAAWKATRPRSRGAGFGASNPAGSSMRESADFHRAPGSPPELGMVRSSSRPLPNHGDFHAPGKPAHTTDCATGSGRLMSPRSTPATGSGPI